MKKLALVVGEQTGIYDEQKQKRILLICHDLTHLKASIRFILTRFGKSSHDRLRTRNTLGDNVTGPPKRAATGVWTIHCCDEREIGKGYALRILVTPTLQNKRGGSGSVEVHGVEAQSNDAQLGKICQSPAPTTATLKHHLLAVVEGFSPNHDRLETAHVYTEAGAESKLFSSSDA